MAERGERADDQPRICLLKRMPIFGGVSEPVLVQLLERVWHFEHPDRPLTLYGWIAALGPRPVVPDPAEVSEVLWLSEAEAAAHPDNLPHTERFVAAAVAAFATGSGAGPATSPGSGRRRGR